MTKLTMNIREDLEGLYKERTQFSNRLYDLLGSIQYRMNAVEWHLRNLCQQHSLFEQKLAQKGLGSSEWHEHHSLYYLFDDFIFNLISLYDYFGSFVYLSFIDPNKQKKMWGKLAKAAGDSNNEFSNCELAQKIFKHHREWVANLNDYRAEIIHYNFKRGGAKKKISIDNVKKTQKTELMYSLPSDLVKRLKIENCKENETGVDLQFGAIEIARRSFSSLKCLAELALTTCTRNSIKFKEKSD